MVKRIFLFLFFVLIAGEVFAEKKLVLSEEEQSLLTKALERVEGLRTLQEEGAEIFPLGLKHGFEGWLILKKEGVKFAYTVPEGDGLLAGLLFGPDGSNVTQEQMKSLVEKGIDLPSFKKRPVPSNSSSPGEKIWLELESHANWFSIGSSNASLLYVIIDPNCVHCKNYWHDLAPLVYEGRLRVRFIPISIGISKKSLRDSAVLLDSKNPSQSWRDHASGNEKVLNVQPSEDSKKKIIRNQLFVQRWKIKQTPYTIYRASDRQVKIIRGFEKQKTLKKILADLIS